MAAKLTSTDAAELASRIRSDSVSAAQMASPRRRVAHALFMEPWWLRGVTWPLVGMIAALAAMQNIPQILRVIVPKHRGEDEAWHFAAFDLSSQLIVGLAIMLIAAVLLNLRRPHVPIPVALFVAVLVGTFLPINAIAYFENVNWYAGICTDCYDKWEVLSAMSIARRIAIPWAIAAAAWYFLHRANARQDALRAADVARRRLETGVIEARLQALQAQVEPHFLFNTLAHIRRLYRTDALHARLMLDSFRAYLHSALPQMRGNAATLGHELDLVRAYLDVQRVRMGRRLTVRVEAPARLREYALPSMMLLCLVENAIKHGLNPLPAGGAIDITAFETSSTIDVCVADTGCGIGDIIGSGTGLANIRGRLAALYGTAARLTLTPNVPNGVRATISLPLRTARSESETDVALAVETT